MNWSISVNSNSFFSASRFDPFSRKDDVSSQSSKGSRLSIARRRSINQQSQHQPVNSNVPNAKYGDTEASSSSASIRSQNSCSDNTFDEYSFILPLPSYTFPTPPRPLPEDFALRGLLWVDKYFPADWFSTFKSDYNDPQRILRELINSWKPNSLEASLNLANGIGPLHKARKKVRPLDRLDTAPVKLGTFRVQLVSMSATPTTNPRSRTRDAGVEYSALGKGGLEEWKRGPGRKKSWNACPVQKRPTRRKWLRNSDRASTPRAWLDPYRNTISCPDKRAMKKQSGDHGPKQHDKRIPASSRKGPKADAQVLNLSPDDLFHPRPDRWRVRQSVLRRQKPPEPVPQHDSLPSPVHTSISENPVVLDLEIERRVGLADECYSAFRNNPCLPGELTGNVARPSWADVARLPSPGNTAKRTAARGTAPPPGRGMHKSKARGTPGLQIPDFRDYRSFADYVETQMKVFLQKCATLRHMAMDMEAATGEEYQKLIKVVRKRKTQLFPLLAARDLCKARVPDQFLARTAKPGLCSLHFCFASSCSTVLWNDGQEGYMQFTFSGDTVVGVEGEERFQTSLGEYLVLDPRRLLQDCQTV